MVALYYFWCRCYFDANMSRLLRIGLKLLFVTVVCLILYRVLQLLIGGWSGTESIFTLVSAVVIVATLFGDAIWGITNSLIKDVFGKRT